MRLNVAYLRVSTEAQTEKYGLDVQRDKIGEYCKRHKIKIDRWYTDGGYSGSKLERPEIQRLLDDCKKGEIGTIYVYKLDRLSRDTVDTLNLINKVFPDCGVNVVSMTEEIRTVSPMDKVTITMNAAMNQYEREVMRMRMSAGMLERVKKGLWMGGGKLPFGYYYDRNDGILHPSEEAEKVREAYRLYLDGYSCERISKILGLKGDQIVHQILKRKTNIGLIEYRGEVYQGKHEPIVDEKLFYEVQKMMKKRTTNAHVTDNNMLTGLCFCGVCGARMRYQKWGKYHKIVCYSQYKNKEYMIRDRNCDNDKEFATEVESSVEALFMEFVANVDEGRQEKSNADFVESEIAKANAKIKKLYNIYIENESENLMEMIKAEESRVKELKKQLEAEKEKAYSSTADKLDEIRRMSDVWDSLKDSEKNRVLKLCVEKVIITHSRIDIHFATL